MNRSLRPVAARIRPNNATISHRLRRLCLLLAIGLCLMHASASQGADGNAAGAEPPLTPRLQVLAEFTTKPRCPVYESGEPVSLWVAIDGRRTADEKLIWTVNDYQGAVRDKGEVAVPKGDARWSTTLAMGDYGAGYFEVHVSLKRSGETLPQMGTRPPGFAAYGVLPSIERQALARVDDSRFGAQGTNFVASGEIGKGDFVDPVYPLLGAKWIYLNRRLGEIFGKAADSYQPVLDPETFRKTPNYEAKAGLCLLVDLHSVPAWLADVPEGRSLSQEGGNAVTEAGQRYPPKDFGVYKSLVAKLVAEQTVRCATLFPGQARNYYQIHWEPDWHWRGTDEAFIEMYRVAREAIRENDPNGLLLGPNYGVLKKGNELLERLFTKGLGEHLDGLLTHAYSLAPGTPEDGGMVADMRALVAMTRANLPAGSKIIQTEWGTWWAGRPPGVDSEALRSEAARFMRGHLITLGEGVDTTFFFYTADSGRNGGGLLYNLTSPHPAFGATHTAPKPVFMAVATATRLLEGSRSLGAIEYLGEGVLGYAFDRAGECLLAVWSRDGRRRSVAVPVGAAPGVSVLDPMGNAKPLECLGGVATIEIGPIPVWLRGVAPAAVPLEPAAARATKRPSGFAGETVAAFPGRPEAAIRLFADGTWRDAGGGPGTLQIPDAAAAGPKLVGAFDAVTVALLETMLIDVACPIQATSINDKTGPNLMAIAVMSARNVDIAGSLAVVHGGRVLAKQEVALKPGERREVTFDLAAVTGSLTPSGDLFLVFTDGKGATCRFAAPLQRRGIAAQRAAAPPAIDGTLDDWNLELFQATVDKAQPALSEATALRIGAQYDDTALYLGFKIRDASHVQERSAAESWTEDALQIGVSLRPDKPSWAARQKICVALSSTNGALLAFRHNAPLKSGDITWAAKHDGDETRYEVAIPWQTLDRDLAGPIKDGLLGFGVMVTDIDRSPGGQLTDRTLLDALGGMSWNNPDDFGMLELK